MSTQPQPKDNSPLTPLAYWQESLAAWGDFSQRSGTLMFEQVSRFVSKADSSEDITETLTAEMLRTLSDFNLRHWQNTARALDAKPDWMNVPSVVNGAAITDWFDRIRRAQTAAPQASGDGPTEAHLVNHRQPETLAAPIDHDDDLTQIKGIGPKLSGRLNGLGIYHFKQIARWTAPEVAWIEDQLTSKGRVTREKWLMQARKHSANGSASLH